MLAAEHQLHNVHAPGCCKFVHLIDAGCRYIFRITIFIPLSAHGLLSATWFPLTLLLNSAQTMNMHEELTELSARIRSETLLFL